MTATTTQAPGIVPIDQAVTLAIGPGNLGRFVDLLEDRSRPRIQYYKGSLTLVSPSLPHERGGNRLDHLIQMIGDELDIPFRATGSTLWRRDDMDAGIEPDQSYYIGHEATVRGRADAPDLTTEPPPDLIVEVVVSHGAANSLAICATLGVPEVWVYNPRKAALEFFRLNPAGRYESIRSSLAFGFLTPSDVLPWLADSNPDEPDNHWRRRLRAWVIAELAPRLRAQAHPEEPIA